MLYAKNNDNLDSLINTVKDLKTTQGCSHI